MRPQVRASDVTVIIPTIEGRETMLARALHSVETQEPAKPARVVVQYDMLRVGAWHTRNQGIAKVLTDWVAFLDDDDEFLPNHLKVLARGASRSGADLIYSYAEFVDAAGQPAHDPLAIWKTDQVLIPQPINEPWSSEAEWSLRRHGSFIPVTNLVRTEALRAVRGFPQPAPSLLGTRMKRSEDCEDYLLLINLLNRGYRFHHVCGVRTWRYYFHDTNTGGRGLDRAG